jgi:CheY-like chemotaxis protein
VKRSYNQGVSPDLQIKLGAIVRVRRQQLGITQEELAWRANLHRSYVADIERGGRNLTVRSVANLAKALQVTVGDLFSYAAPPGEFSVPSEKAAPRPGEILVLEDSEADAALVIRAFRQARITNPLQIFAEAEEALDYLFGARRYSERPRPRPQLILLDLNLPRMSGLEFLRRIRADGRTDEIPVVVLTASQSDAAIAECGRLGALHYIVKPVGIEKVVRATSKLNLPLTLGLPMAAAAAQKAF